MKKNAKYILTMLLLISVPAAFAEVDPNQEPFIFVQLTDPQLGFGGYEHDVNSLEQAVKQINSLKPDLVVICGDLVHDFTEKAVADFKRIKSGLTMPCYFAPGNHDISDNPTAQTLSSYRDAFGEDYFSFEHKGYTFVIANSSLWKAPLAGESEKHDAWFKEKLIAAHNANSPVFVVQHYPIYANNPDEPNNSFSNLPIVKRKELLTLIEQNGVVAVLAGHRHTTNINDYKGIQLVNCEATSRNNDRRPLGFRVWQVSPKAVKHEFVPLESEKAQVN
ncbi:MAG: metallophosphoesterase [Sedimentisphaerales bacterium]|nr:metallophosphoesterase [Sedimentisphaerales bacterium]